MLPIPRCALLDSPLFFLVIDMYQDYWAERDESAEYPHELHAALANDGWLGIALPEDLGGAGLGISEATMMLHTISEYVKLSHCRPGSATVLAIETPRSKGRVN